MPSVLDVPSHLIVPQRVPRHWLRLWAVETANAGGANGSLIWEVWNYEEWPADETKNWRWLYVARSPTSGIVKVGLSATPMRRIDALVHDYSGRFGRFEAVALIPYCSRAHERKLCGLLSGYRHVGYEWHQDCIATRVLCWKLAEWRDDWEVRYECTIAATAQSRSA